jgi:Zn-dependent peptidase ImmA (M78 family)
MVTVLLKAHHLGFIADYERVSDEDMPDDLAAFDPDTRRLRIRDSTFIVANEVVSSPTDRPRARFTIAHELGHLFLKHKRTRHRNISGRPIEKIAPSIVRDERDADRFAAAFLAPALLIENPLLVTTRELSDRFGLSLQSSEIRLETLQRLYRRAHGIPRPIPQSIYELLSEAAKSGGKFISLENENRRRLLEAKPKENKS